MTACQWQNNKPDPNLVSIALGSAPSSTNPVKATDASGMRLVALTHQSLVRIGKDLKPTGDLAFKWALDGKKHSFYISKETKFSDGSPLKCSDLKNSIHDFQSDTCPFKAAFKDIKNVKCMNTEDHFLLSFETPTDSEKFLLADLPVLKIRRGALGTGAFTVKESSPAHTLLKSNPHYVKPQAYDLKFFYLKDDLARFLKVYKGEIDIAPNSIPFEKIRAFKKTKMRVLEKPSLSTSYLLINFKNKNLQKLEVRKKIYKALNIPELVKYRFDNHVTLAKSLLFPEHPYYSSNLSTLKHSSSDDALTLSQFNFKTSNSRQTRETGKIISHKLKNSGFKINFQSFEWGTFYKDVKGGRFDIALMKWVGVVDPDLYNIAFHSNEFPPGRNRGYYTNSDLDQILERGRSSKNSKERLEIYREVQDLVFKELAIIPLWHENQIHIVHPRIEGYELNPMGDFSSFLNLKVSNQSKPIL